MHESFAQRGQQRIMAPWFRIKAMDGAAIHR
jgi:hypothetical protein